MSALFNLVCWFVCVISIFNSSCFSLDLNAQCQECVFTIVSPEDRLQFGPSTALPKGNVTKIYFLKVWNRFVQMSEYICLNSKLLLSKTPEDRLQFGPRALHHDLALKQRHKYIFLKSLKCFFEFLNSIFPNHRKMVCSLEFGPRAAPRPCLQAASQNIYFLKVWNIFFLNVWIYLFYPKHRKIVCSLDPAQRHDLALKQRHKIYFLKVWNIFV